MNETFHQPFLFPATEKENEKKSGICASWNHEGLQRYNQNGNRSRECIYALLLVPLPRAFSIISFIDLNNREFMIFSQFFVCRWIYQTTKRKKSPYIQMRELEIVWFNPSNRIMDTFQWHKFHRKWLETVQYRKSADFYVCICVIFCFLQFVKMLRQSKISDRFITYDFRVERREKCNLFNVPIKIKTPS